MRCGSGGASAMAESEPYGAEKQSQSVWQQGSDEGAGGVKTQEGRGSLNVSE